MTTWVLPTVWILISHRSLLLRITKTFPTSNITDKKLCNIFCSATEVEKLLRNLKIYKSPGPGYISPRILRQCVQVLSSPLTLFLNTSFFSRSTTMHMEVCPHHSSSQEREQKSYVELPPNITDLYCVQDCRSCGQISIFLNQTNLRI